MKILETRALTKKYGNITAVDSLDMVLEEGKVLGLLGPNGSGKTTTLGMTLGTIIPSSGQFSWWTQKEPNKKIGTLLETPNFFSYLNAIDNLKVVQKIKDSTGDNLDYILKLVGLYERRKSTFKTFSLGMKQRLALAATLIADPKVLILDEPTNGLDPNGIAEIRDIILKIAQEGKTILLASHILDEVEKVCSDVIILKNGAKLASGSVGHLIGGDNIYSITSQNLEELEQVLKEMNSLVTVEVQGDHLVASFQANVTGEDINRYSYNKGIVLSSLSPIKKRLEEEFLKLVN